MIVLKSPSEIEIMTGGVLPQGTDCVIAVERLDVCDGVARVEQDYEPERNQFIHPQGSDYRHGDVVLGPGSAISAMDVAIIASCGLEQVLVSERPAIRVVSTRFQFADGDFGDVMAMLQNLLRVQAELGGHARDPFSRVE